MSSCCGVVNLQKACILTASFEIVLAVIFLFYDVVLLAVETPKAVDERNDAIETPDPYRFHSIRVVLSGLNSLFWIGSLFLGLILVLGAKQRDLRKCRSWYILTCILTVLFICDVLLEAFSMTAPALAIVSPTLGTILQCYMLWIVTDFMDELTHNGCSLPVKSLDDDMDA